MAEPGDIRFGIRADYDTSSGAVAKVAADLAGLNANLEDLEKSNLRLKDSIDESAKGWRAYTDEVVTAASTLATIISLARGFSIAQRGLKRTTDAIRSDVAGAAAFLDRKTLFENVVGDKFEKNFKTFGEFFEQGVNTAGIFGPSRDRFNWNPLKDAMPTMTTAQKEWDERFQRNIKQIGLAAGKAVSTFSAAMLKFDKIAMGFVARMRSLPTATASLLGKASGIGTVFAMTQIASRAWAASTEATAAREQADFFGVDRGQMVLLRDAYSDAGRSLDAIRGDFENVRSLQAKVNAENKDTIRLLEQLGVNADKFVAADLAGANTQLADAVRDSNMTLFEQEELLEQLGVTGADTFRQLTVEASSFASENQRQIAAAREDFDAIGSFLSDLWSSFTDIGQISETVGQHAAATYGSIRTWSIAPGDPVLGGPSQSWELGETFGAAASAAAVLTDSMAKSASELDQWRKHIELNQANIDEFGEELPPATGLVARIAYGLQASAPHIDTASTEFENLVRGLVAYRIELAYARGAMNNAALRMTDMTAENMIAESISLALSNRARGDVTQGLGYEDTTSSSSSGVDFAALNAAAGVRLQETMFRDAFRDALQDGDLAGAREQAELLNAFKLFFAGFEDTENLRREAEYEANRLLKDMNDSIQQAASRAEDQRIALIEAQREQARQAELARIAAAQDDINEIRRLVEAGPAGDAFRQAVADLPEQGTLRWLQSLIASDVARGNEPEYLYVKAAELVRDALDDKIEGLVGEFGKDINNLLRKEPLVVRLETAEVRVSVDGGAFTVTTEGGQAIAEQVAMSLTGSNFLAPREYEGRQ